MGRPPKDRMKYCPVDINSFYGLADLLSDAEVGEAVKALVVFAAESKEHEGEWKSQKAEMMYNVLRNMAEQTISEYREKNGNRGTGGKVTALKSVLRSDGYTETEIDEIVEKYKQDLRLLSVSEVLELVHKSAQKCTDVHIGAQSALNKVNKIKEKENKERPTGGLKKESAQASQPASPEEEREEYNERPALSDVKAFCEEQGIVAAIVNPEEWHGKMTRNGWKIKGEPVRNWREALLALKPRKGKVTHEQQYEQREYTNEDSILIGQMAEWKQEHGEG